MYYFFIEKKTLFHVSARAYLNSHNRQLWWAPVASHRTFGDACRRRGLIYKGALPRLSDSNSRFLRHECRQRQMAIIGEGSVVVDALVEVFDRTPGAVDAGHESDTVRRALSGPLSVTLRLLWPAFGC
jgi:hypothetical protein